MRYIFISLLLCNLVYFSWSQFIREVPAIQKVSRNVQQAGDRLILLSEPSPASDNNVSLMPAPEVEVELQEILANPIGDLLASGSSCLAIGPFDDVRLGQQAGKLLASLDYQFELAAIDAETDQSVYRVLIPPERSMQAAYRKLRELQSRNIDSYVITKGPSALGISLGVFSRESTALEVQSKSAEAGYDTVIAPISRISRGYWLVSAPGESPAISGEIWSRLVELEANIRRDVQVCPK